MVPLAQDTLCREVPPNWSDLHENAGPHRFAPVSVKDHADVPVGKNGRKNFHHRDPGRILVAQFSFFSVGGLVQGIVKGRDGSFSFARFPQFTKFSQDHAAHKYLPF
jgi:hypothetical protein